MHIVGFDFWSFVVGLVAGNITMFLFICMIAFSRKDHNERK